MPASPSSSSDMLNVCKHAAAWLDIPWPAIVAKTTRSREGKKLPLARSPANQTCLPRVAGTDGALMEGMPLKQQEPVTPLGVPRSLALPFHRASMALHASTSRPLWAMPERDGMRGHPAAEFAPPLMSTNTHTQNSLFVLPRAQQLKKTIKINRAVATRAAPHWKTAVFSSGRR